MEIDAAHVLLQLLDAIGYLHKNGIAHRDLKPENVLVVSSDKSSPDYWTVKLSDFGLSVQRESVMENVMSTLHGTPEFAAPEVLLLSKDKRQGMYSAKIDIWAIGCIAYVLLSSRTPFGSNGNVPAMMGKIIEGKYHFRGSTWRGVSDMAIRFDSSRIPSNFPLFSARRRAILSFTTFAHLRPRLCPEHQACGLKHPTEGPSTGLSPKFLQVGMIGSIFF